MTFTKTPTSAVDKVAGEICMEEDIHERMRPSVKCPKCGDVSYLRNWIDGGCDWCDYNPDRLKIAEVTADDVLETPDDQQNTGDSSG